MWYNDENDYVIIMKIKKNDDSPMGRGCTFELTLRSGDEKTVGIGTWWNGVSEDEQAQSTKGWFLSFEFESISFDLNLLWEEFMLKKVWRNYWLKKETIFKICIPQKKPPNNKKEVGGWNTCDRTGDTEIKLRLSFTNFFVEFWMLTDVLHEQHC